MATLRTEPCRRSTGGNDQVGAPCPDCGHTNLVHSRWNNQVEACVICEMEVAFTQVNEALVTIKEQGSL